MRLPPFTHSVFLSRSDIIEQSFKELHDTSGQDIPLSNVENLIDHLIVNNSIYLFNICTVGKSNILEYKYTNVDSIIISVDTSEIIFRCEIVDSCPHYKMVREKVGYKLNLIEGNSDFVKQLSEIFENQVKLQSFDSYSKEEIENVHKFREIYNSTALWKMWKRPEIENDLKELNLILNFVELLHTQDYILNIMEFIEDPYTLARFSQVCKVINGFYQEFRVYLWNLFKNRIILIKGKQGKVYNWDFLDKSKKY